ncbi:hypothetical protein KEM48_010140 [Puccinia striiformis f. sp. tritici PST-130]|nr:hypothetical protein KEM48_010140 [Puccinia striiformis f. sp. tritici PST-130]
MAGKSHRDDLVSSTDPDYHAELPPSKKIKHQATASKEIVDATYGSYVMPLLRNNHMNSAEATLSDLAHEDGDSNMSSESQHQHLEDTRETYEERRNAASPAISGSRWPGGSHGANGHTQNQAIPSESENITFPLPEVNFETTDPALWAWVYSMKLGISDLLYQELMFENEANISEFIISLASHVTQVRKQETTVNVMNNLTSRESVNSFKEFVHLLWCVNSKFIRHFRPSDQNYLQEQAAVQNWITHLFSESQKSKDLSIGGGHRITLNSSSSEGGLINFMWVALVSRYSHPHYELFSRKTFQATGAVCQKQILMAEAVVNILATYYKMENSVKWRALFATDQEFVHTLTKIQNWSSDDRRVFQETKQLDPNAVFPWRTTIDAGSVNHFCQRERLAITTRGPRKLKTEPRVRLMEISYDQSDHMSGDKIDSFHLKMTNFNSRNRALLHGNPDKMWAFISRLTSDCDKFITGDLVRLKCDSIMESLNAWRVHQIASPSAEIKTHIGLLKSDQFLIEVKKLLDLIWNINSRLVENLGQSTYGPIFLQEQDKLQKEFYALLTSSHDISDGFYSGAPESKNNRDLQEIILKAIGSSDRAALYKIKRYKDVISKKRIMMTEAAVKVMISYYWNNNPSKGLKIFLDEEKFVLNLAQIETRLFRKTIFWEFQNTYFQELKHLELLPWKNHFILTEDNSSVIKKSFQAHSFADSLLKLEEYTQ